MTALYFDKVSTLGEYVFQFLKNAIQASSNNSLKSAAQDFMISSAEKHETLHKEFI